ncbi:hypothetical protein CLAFUR4_10157 [Fulvia fulva]|nr:hypothetical protein CLAFUR4_10157 [Fulvia fulva]KAK4616645.1 hypothetical protein CLAFUR0_10155 [Fulvia fulva]WPV33759.1 hypothetical protein CLAFUW7_10153 [Fulvia fulva]
MFQIKAATTTNENNTNNPCTLTASTEPPAVSSQYLPVSPVATMGHIKWPPSLLRTDILGEITDTSGRKIARDIGRAVWLGGNCYYAFGDTFCHDVKNEFCGVTNNSIAYVPDPRGAPTQSTYIDYAAGNPGAVRAFVGYTDGERQHSVDAQGKEKHDRVTCWSFGGIVEDREGCGSGWVFFDKMITVSSESGKHYGIGVARATVQPDKSIKLERPMGDETVFKEGEPKFGSISHLCDDDGFVYLMGGYDPTPGSLDMRCHLARIRRDADFTKRENYSFFCDSMDMKGEWRQQYDDPNQLAKMGDLDIQAQGKLFKTPDFAPEGRRYMWIGVNKFMAGHFYVGSAPAITGPWEVHDFGELPNDPHPYDGHSSGPKYALYPNPRASDLARGEMLCTWTDAAQMGGKVIAAKFWFEGDYERPPPPAPGVVEGGQGGHGAEHKHGDGKDKLKRDFLGGLLPK